MSTLYRFKFIHNDPQNPNPKSPLYPKRFGTVCEILSVTGLRIASGIAILAPTDRYSKPLGRKLSAARAIRSFIPRRPVATYSGWVKRSDLWNQLFAESPSTRAAKRGA